MRIFEKIVDVIEIGKWKMKKKRGNTWNCVEMLSCGPGGDQSGPRRDE